MYTNNLNCMKNIINFCIKRKSKLIHISSTSVYGKQAVLVDETCEKKYLKPQSPYAKIKLIEENLLKKQKKLKYPHSDLEQLLACLKELDFIPQLINFVLMLH